MPRSCPRCKSPLDDQGQCAGCGFSLPPAEAKRVGSRRLPTRGGWQQTTWGRILIGLVIALGLFYGMMLLANAAILVTNDQAARAAWWGSYGGLLMFQVMQAGSLFMGGIIAGAGHRRGTLYGAIVGIYGGFIFLVVNFMILNQPTKNVLWLFALPVLSTAFAALGGFIATQIWKPIIPVTALPTAPESGTSAGGFTLKAPAPSPFAGPINWVRILAGTALAVAGTLSAQAILKFIEAQTEQPLDTRQQSQLITFEISVLALLVGGAVAGSNTNHGIKQGLIMGIFAGVVLVFNQVWRGAGDPAITIGFSLAGAVRQQNLFPRIVATIVMSISLGLAGGWFGSQLMPPLTLSRRERMFATFR